MQDLDNLLKARGVSQDLAGHVTAIIFNRAGSHAGFALGDGTLRIADGASGWASIPAHDGAILALAAHPTETGFLTGGDDGKLNAIGLDGVVSKIADYGSRWVDQIATFAGKAPLIAVAAGKNVHLLGAKGEPIRSLAHPSTVTGIAFDGKGKRIAAAHYNGASLWFTGSNADPRKLEWKGSHIGIMLHPHGEALVTSMQENALHGWTLPEGKHMRMSGYPSKIESFGFTHSGRWLATAGADAIVLWPFFGGGPMGKPPMELAAMEETLVKRIACHPEHEVVAAGLANGQVILADIVKEQILPVCGPGRGSITALAWNPTGSHLAFGSETGFAAIVDFSSPG